MTTYSDRWERFLDPNVVRPSLFLATMFITTFEILKDSIVSRIRDFYSIGFDPKGTTVSPQYQTEVLSRSKSPVYASLSWLQEHDAITSGDIAIYDELKTTRNVLAHQLFSVVTGQVESRHSQQLDQLVGLLRKIEVWWVINVDIPTNPDYDGQDIDEAGIVPGPVLSLQMLIQVASGSTELLEQWRKMGHRDAEA